jgi:hypothetical protein
MNVNKGPSQYMLPHEFNDLLQSEFNYWNDGKPDRELSIKPEVFGAIQIGATGAIANVIAALNGHPAPWHVGQPGDKNGVWPCRLRRWGWGKFGIFEVRILLPNDTKTIWQFTVWQFSFGLSLPASLVNLLVRWRDLWNNKSHGPPTPS